MKKLGLLLTLMSAAAVPLLTYMSQRQQSKQSRLQSLTGPARDRAKGAGEAAIDTLGSWGESTRETLGDLAGATRDRLSAVGHGSRERAATTSDTAGNLAARAGTLLAGAPRIVAQFRSDNDGYPYGSRDDWRKYGDVFD